jgi:hypothetical protein
MLIVLFQGGQSMASDHSRTVRFEMDGKPVSQLDFQAKLASLKEIPDSRTSAKGEDQKGHSGFVVRYEAQDSAGDIWGVQEISTSESVIHSVTRRTRKPWESQDPLQFLEALKKNPGCTMTVEGEAPAGWITQKHVQVLLGLLGSKEPASPVYEIKCPTLPKAPSTVGRQAAFLLMGFISNHYPPAGQSDLLYDSDEQIRQRIPNAARDSLRCEIRGNENGNIVFDEAGPGNLHFILSSSQEGLKVFQEWNSWGFYARSFLAVDEKDKAKRYRLAHRIRPWDKNFAATHLLNAGQFLITDIHLCDGSWAVEPKLPEDVPARLILTGIFEIKTDAESKAQDVWTGRIESVPKSAFIDRFCVKRLNETHADGTPWGSKSK